MGWKCIIPGIEYEITTSHTEKGKEKTFIMSFLHKRDGNVIDGIITEDVINILIDRLQKLSRDKSDRFTDEATFNLTKVRRNLADRQNYMRKLKQSNKEQ